MLHSSPSFKQLPTHVGIIMDGNRRWARRHTLESLQGHRYVSEKVIEPLVLRCAELGIPYLTLWAFSTENWHRDQQEVEGLMGLFREGFERNGARLHEQGVRLRAIGDISRFAPDIQKGVQKWVDATAKNTRITVSLALNYGGRDELDRAMHQVVKNVLKEVAEANGEEEKKKKIVELMTDEHLRSLTLAPYLDTAEMPDVDLIIRPGGEKRLSGFLPWQSVYAEFYFTDLLMPDFSPAELDKALTEFDQRKRRFGT